MEDNRVLPGNHARGWNDPPQFLYDPRNPTGSVNPDNPLLSNKRVGHAISDSSSGPSSEPPPLPAVSIAPPAASLPAVLGHVPILNMPSKDSKKDVTTPEPEVHIPDIDGDEEQCQYCVQCFGDSLKHLQGESSIEERLSKDITRRIAMFEKCWKSGKLSTPAKPKCMRLARALELKAFGAANSFHLQLMTDHVSEVSQWMVGIKKLIQAGLDSANL